MKTTRELNTAIGQSVGYRVGQLVVNVVVRDVRTMWGRVDCLIQPVSGDGEQWVAIDSLCPALGKVPVCV